MSTDDTARTEDYDAGQDQDAEPTMNAPEEGRPDGLEALHPDEDREAGGITPKNTDAEVLEAQEEEGPADE